MRMSLFFQFTFQIKNFDRFMFHKTKSKNKKCFSSRNVLAKHKEDCLSINGKQSVKIEKGIIEFEDYFKQIPVPSKIYSDFECNLRGVKSYEGFYTQKSKITFFVVLLAKLFELMIGLLSQLLFLEVQMRHMNLLKQFVKSISTAKK